MLSCVILAVTVSFLFWEFGKHPPPLALICTGWTQPLASPDSEHCRPVTTPGGGDLGITFLQLWRWVHGACPAMKGGLDRLARLAALSQWAVRNGRGNENQPQVCCPLPCLQAEPPQSIPNAYSAAAAVRVAVMCLKSLSSCLYSGPHLLLRRKSSEKGHLKPSFSACSHSVWNSNQISVELNHISPQGAI